MECYSPEGIGFRADWSCMMFLRDIFSYVTSHFAWHLARREHDVIFNGNPDRKSDSISFTGHRPSPPNTTIHVAVTVPFVSFESRKSRFREVLWDGTYEICSLPRRLECLPYYLQIRNKATGPTNLFFLSPKCWSGPTVPKSHARLVELTSGWSRCFLPICLFFLCISL